MKHLAAALALWSSSFTGKATQPFPFVRAIYTDLEVDEPVLLRLFNAGRFIDELQCFREFLRLLVRYEAQAAMMFMITPRQVERGRTREFLGRFSITRYAFEMMRNLSFRYSRKNRSLHYTLAMAKDLAISVFSTRNQTLQAHDDGNPSQFHSAAQ